MLLVLLSATICSRPKRFSDVSIKFSDDMVLYCFLTHVRRIFLFKNIFLDAFLLKKGSWFSVGLYVSLFYYQKVLFKVIKTDFFISFSWDDLFRMFFSSGLCLRRTCIRYLRFYDVFYCKGKILSQIFFVFTSILFLVQNYYWFCIVCFFTINTPPFDFSESSTTKIKSTTTMDCYLSILEVPQPKQEELYEESKIKFINSKISLWDYFRIPKS